MTPWMYGAFVDELEKIGGLPSIMQLLARAKGVEWHMRERERTRRNLIRALEEGYPAGWVFRKMYPAGKMIDVG